MSKKLLTTLALVVAISFFGVAQGSVNTDLQNLLPLESEVQEILGENWVINEIRSFGSLPPGGLGSGIGEYTDGSSEIMIVLIAFEDNEIAGSFIDGFLESDTVSEASDVVENNADDVTEQLANLVDRILLVSLESGQSQLVVQINSLYFYIRVDSVELESLIALADLQLTRTVEFCEALEGEAPQYCPPVPEEESEETAE